MDMEEALKKICERVLMFEMDESKNGGSPKAVVCISGSTFGYEKAMAELVRLKEAGWRFDVFMSDTGMLLHDPAKVREQLEPEHICSRRGDAGACKFLLSSNPLPHFLLDLLNRCPI